MTGQTARKTKPTLTLEKQHNGPVCGIDEAGRGPLAGPVVASCVYIPEKAWRQPFLKAVNDSKKLTLKKRETLFVEIREHCAFGIGAASPEEIDTLNIHHATLLAMKRAFMGMLDGFEIRPDLALVDGKFTPALPCNAEAIKQGDGRSLSIAAASILAKVTRDRAMNDLHREHPAYGWDHNAGYGTAEHLEALKTHGVTPYHRQSFAPVREALTA